MPPKKAPRLSQAKRHTGENPSSVPCGKRTGQGRWRKPPRARPSPYPPPPPPLSDPAIFPSMPPPSSQRDSSISSSSLAQHSLPSSAQPSSSLPPPPARSFSMAAQRGLVVLGMTTRSRRPASMIVPPQVGSTANRRQRDRSTARSRCALHACTEHILAWHR